MRKGFVAVLALLIFLLLPLQAAAAEADMQFAFSLTVDGGNSKEVETGDIITVVLKLNRQDLEEPYTMYAMQDEIRYDSAFFELVNGSVILNQGINSTDIATTDQHRELYMNFLSMSGGNTWNSETLVGSFQLRVIGTSGVTKITNEDFLVSFPDGSGGYPCKGEDVTVILSKDCLITYATNGGSHIPDQIAEYGTKLARPENPVRPGYHLEGWYRDIDLSDAWDFETDTVQGNMTLYAKWAAGDPVAEELANNLWMYGLMIAGFLALAFCFLLILKRKKQKSRRK